MVTNGWRKKNIYIYIYESLSLSPSPSHWAYLWKYSSGFIMKLQLAAAASSHLVHLHTCTALKLNYSKIEMIAPAFQTGNGLERVLVFRIWAGFQHAYAKMLSKKRPRQSTAIWRLTLTRRSEGVTVVEHHQFSLLVDKVHQIWCQDIHLSRWTMWTRMALIGKWQIFSDQSVPWMSALPVFLLLALHESLESVFFLRKWQTTNNIIPCKREVTGGTSNKESRKLAVE